MSKSEVFQFVSAQMKELGYRCEIIEDDVIGSSASGLKFLVLFYSGSIQFRCIFGNFADRISEGQVTFANKFNSEVRFSNLYADDEEDLILESDCLLQPNDDGARKTFERFFELWELALGEVKTRIREIEKYSGSKGE